MKTVALTRVVLFGEPPQKYSVTFSVGSRFVRIVGPSRGGERTSRVMEWRGAAFRPGCVAMTEQAVAFFREVEANVHPDDRSELANHELMITGRLPATKRHDSPNRLDCHERQLPVGDRMEVG